MTLLNPPEYDSDAERLGRRQIKAFTLLCGLVGLLVPIVLTVMISGGTTLSSSVLFALWPTSIFGLGFNGPSISWIGLILIVVEFGGNFILYGLIGFLLSTAHVWLRSKW